MDWSGFNGVVVSSGYEIVYVGGTLFGGYIHNQISFWTRAMSYILGVLGRDFSFRPGIAVQFSSEIEEWLGKCWGSSLYVEVTMHESLTCDILVEGGRNRPQSEIKKMIKVFVGDGQTVGYFHVRRRPHVASLLEISAAKVADCLHLEGDVGGLEIPLTLKTDIVSKYGSWWITRFCSLRGAVAIMSCCAPCFVRQASVRCSDCGRFIKSVGAYGVVVPGYCELNVF